ncbi:MAG: diguanylate cyclase [Immundisolibacteraceae bacterium]|nr:diguanylate cyclase [Immundisolibacteraceae bacterium]
MKLVIAEDDPTSRAMLQAVSSQWGYEPLLAEDGNAAWDLMHQEDPPRLLILDWEMPNLDGVTLCARIREVQTTDPPFIILLTARNEPIDVVTALDAGANDYIIKPFEPIELKARLEVGRRMLNLQARMAEAQLQLTYQATHDPLTNLLNRRAIMSALDLEMVRAHRQMYPLAIGMCDIDHFKKINDEHGHLVGDEVLKEVSKRIASALRPYDPIGRYGGEEFLILLNSCGLQVTPPFERLLETVGSTPIIAHNVECRVTLSCGVAVYEPPQDQRDVTSLLAAADLALYEAKHAGRNRTVFEPPKTATIGLPKLVSN